MADTTQNEIMSQSDNLGGSSLLKQSSNALSNALKFTSQPSVQRALPVIVASVAIIVGLIVFAYLQQPSRTTLYASLPDSEKSKVLEALVNSGIDAAIDGATGEVTVPVNDFHRSKISLAAQGLPATAPDGYEGLNSIPMGSSKSVELMRLKQSQEVELAKSINEIDTILSARVHLAIPEKSVFARNQQPPTASVFVQLASGRVLGAQQVQAIIHLVSSSIPNMSKDDVTVIDQNGNLLSKSIDDPDSQLSDSHLQHRMRLEGIYRSRIVQIITPMVGAGNVTAQVNIDIDFNVADITNIDELNDLSFKLNIEQGNISPSDSSIMWKDDLKITLVESLFINDQKNVNLIGKILVDITDIDDFYKSFQIKKDLRKKIKQFQIDFNYNFNTKQISFDNVKIDNNSNESLETFINNFNSREKRIFNKITFKNFVNDFFKAYAG